MLMLFLKSTLEAVDHVNYGNHQTEDSGIHKCHVTGSSTNSWRPKVVGIYSFFLFTAIVTHVEDKLV